MESGRNHLNGVQVQHGININSWDGFLKRRIKEPSIGSIAALSKHGALRDIQVPVHD